MLVVAWKTRHLNKVLTPAAVVAASSCSDIGHSRIVVASSAAAAAVDSRNSAVPQGLLSIHQPGTMLRRFPLVSDSSIGGTLFACPLELRPHLDLVGLYHS